MHRDRDLDELIAEMRNRSHHCIRITENEMDALRRAGGRVTHVRESPSSTKLFWIEVEFQGGYFFADCEISPPWP